MSRSRHRTSARSPAFQAFVEDAVEQTMDRLDIQGTQMDSSYHESDFQEKVTVKWEPSDPIHPDQLTLTVEKQLHAESLDSVRDTPATDTPRPSAWDARDPFEEDRPQAARTVTIEVTTPHASTHTATLEVTSDRTINERAVQDEMADLIGDAMLDHQSRTSSKEPTMSRTHSRNRYAHAYCDQCRRKMSRRPRRALEGPSEEDLEEIQRQGLTDLQKDVLQTFLAVYEQQGAKQKSFDGARAQAASDLAAEGILSELGPARSGKGWMYQLNISPRKLEDMVRTSHRRASRRRRPQSRSRKHPARDRQSRSSRRRRRSRRGQRGPARR